TSALAAVVFSATLVAQPRLTLDYPAIAQRLVRQLALKPGERVMSIAQPGVWTELLQHIRYEVMRAGGIDLGVVEILSEPVPESFDTAVLQKGARESRAFYKAMFRDVDAAIMMPGATPAHPAYAAMQDWLKDDLTEHRGRRTIHFHWVENGSAYVIPGQPLPPRPVIDALYQQALLRTDYQALAAIERRFAAALATGEVHITSPLGTDLRFRAGSRPINFQDGDASASRAAQGKIIAATAETAQAARDEVARNGEAGRTFREFALGFSPLLAVPERAPWIPYYGYGSGVVRLSLGDNTELGGQVGGGYVRWNFFTDLTVTVGGVTWVKDGRLIDNR
ncbi:MAG: hypothetical protein HY048_04950, partial [Acidobacteria bacterium]|nr:hypothetical protein [Acidobacteriota bacterium]